MKNIPQRYRPTTYTKSIGPSSRVLTPIFIPLPVAVPEKIDFLKKTLGINYSKAIGHIDLKFSPKLFLIKAYCQEFFGHGRIHRNMTSGDQVVQKNSDRKLTVVLPLFPFSHICLIVRWKKRCKHIMTLGVCNAVKNGKNWIFFCFSTFWRCCGISATL